MIINNIMVMNLQFHKRQGNLSLVEWLSTSQGGRCFMMLLISLINHSFCVWRINKIINIILMKLYESVIGTDEQEHVTRLPYALPTMLELITYKEDLFLYLSIHPTIHPSIHTYVSVEN
jgi:hypothetical protein